jgi:hypothetical protein
MLKFKKITRECKKYGKLVEIESFLLRQSTIFAKQVSNKWQHFSTVLVIVVSFNQSNS